MGWQLYLMFGVVALGIVYMAFRIVRKEARAVGGEREARETLEKLIEMDEKRHKLDGIPIPLSKRKQLNRLRALLEKRLRNRG